MSLSERLNALNTQIEEFYENEKLGKKPKISKEDILNYVNTMKILKAGFGGGGLDKVDVYNHIHKIVQMSDTYLEGELKEMEERHEEEIARIKGAVQGEIMGHTQNSLADQEQSDTNQPSIKDKKQILEELEKKLKDSEQELLDYINKMDIKKAGFAAGGLDKVDVYTHIQQIVTRYDKRIRMMKESYEDEENNNQSAPITTQ